MIEFDRAIESIATNPSICPSYSHGTQVRRLRRFPHLLVFRHLPNSIQVIAVAHGKRRPDYWKKRIP